MLAHFVVPHTDAALREGGATIAGLCGRFSGRQQGHPPQQYGSAGGGLCEGDHLPPPGLEPVS